MEKIQDENKEYKDTLNSRDETITDYEEKLALTADAGRQIIALVDKLKARDLALHDLVAQVETQKTDLYTVSRSLKITTRDYENCLDQLNDARE